MMCFENIIEDPHISKAELLPFLLVFLNPDKQREESPVGVGVLPPGQPQLWLCPQEKQAAVAEGARTQVSVPQYLGQERNRLRQ